MSKIPGQMSTTSQWSSAEGRSFVVRFASQQQRKSIWFQDKGIRVAMLKRENTKVRGFWFVLCLIDICKQLKCCFFGDDFAFRFTWEVKRFRQRIWEKLISMTSLMTLISNLRLVRCGAEPVKEVVVRLLAIIKAFRVRRPSRALSWRFQRATLLIWTTF